MAIAEGARSVPGTAVTIKRVPELMPEEVARKAGVKLDQKAPIAKPDSQRQSHAPGNNHWEPCAIQGSVLVRWSAGD